VLTFAQLVDLEHLIAIDFGSFWGVGESDILGILSNLHVSTSFTETVESDFGVAQMDIQRIQAELARFAVEREWEQFHSPKNLTMALAGEAGELLALFQWLTEDESRNITTNPTKLARIREEMADVFIYLARLADVLRVDMEQIVCDKMADNANRYPVTLAKGNAIKYSERDDA